MKPSLVFNQVSVLAAASRAMVGNVEHMVVPVIAAREGVMNGIFYSEKELEASAAAWNGVPLPVTHPKDDDGNFITANSVEAEEALNVGKFFKVHFDKKTKALKGELWIDIPKAKLLGHEEMLDRLDAGENMDVSTGLWTNTKAEKGKFKGKDYTGVAQSITPDHLALLPNETGACSPKDGCGTFIHNHAHKEGGPCCESCATKEKGKKERGVFANALLKVGSVLGFTANETSHSELHRSLSAHLRQSMKGTNKYAWVMDTYDKFFVYEQDEMLFRQEYKQDKQDQIEFVGDPLQVMVKRTYETVSPKIATNNENKKTVKAQHIQALAAMLAANSITTEEHTSLSGLSDSALDTILTNAVKPAPAAEPNVVAAPATSGLSANERTLLDELSRDRENQITSLRTHVKAAKILPDTVVDTLTLTQLRETAGSIQANSGTPGNLVDFSLAGGAPQIAANAEQETTPAYKAPSFFLAPATDASKAG